VNNFSLSLLKSNLKTTEIRSSAIYRVLACCEARLEAVVSFWFGLLRLLILMIVSCFSCVLLQREVVGSAAEQVDHQNVKSFLMFF